MVHEAACGLGSVLEDGPHVRYRIAAQVHAQVSWYLEIYSSSSQIGIKTASFLTPM